MKKQLGAVIALSLLGTGLVASTTTESAGATPTWPLLVEDTAVYGITADDNGGISLSSCRTGGNYNSYPMAYYLDEEQVVRNQLQSYGDKPQFCDNYGMESLNGILLSYYPTSSNTSVLTARKNNLQLWEANTSSPTDCDVTSAVNKTMYPRSVSVGSDGNFYMVLTYLAGDLAMSCPERLFGVDKDTGAVIMDEALTTPSSPTYNKTQAWTYEDYVLVLDRAGTLHKFEYDGDEVTNADYPYEFEITTGRMFYLSAANSAGTVYVMSATTSYGSNALMYHTDSGDDGSISNTIHSTNASAQYTFDKDGNFIHIIGNQYLDLFSLSGGTVSSITPSNPSGYPSAYIIDYVEDGDGNALVQWELSNSGTSTRAISIDFIDGSSSAVTNLFLESGTGNARPSGFPNLGIDRSIANGYLYLSLCKDQSSGCGNGSNPPDSWIYRVDVGDFGDPVTHLFGQSGYVSTDLKYVAMGDSFASGDGVTPYIDGTNESGDNECHRSETSYAIKLDNESALDLSLDAFAACSGATTSNVLTTPQLGEQTQISALQGGDVDIVSLSVGGNNVGFATYAAACFLSRCDFDSLAYAGITAAIEDLDNTAIDDNLIDTYEAILNELPLGGDLYVINYPMMLPEGIDSSDSLSIYCPYMYDGEDEFDIWGDGLAAYDVIARLNAKIESVVYDISLMDDRIHYVDISASFEGHDICSDNSYFFNALVDPVLFHPGYEAQQIISDALRDAIS
ncbi:MAG: SGNH/GDSL hydrolase family protein [Candidatus Microsaccharimonas sp.]